MTLLITYRTDKSTDNPDIAHVIFILMITLMDHVCLDQEALFTCLNTFDQQVSLNSPDSPNSLNNPRPWSSPVPEFKESIVSRVSSQGYQAYQRAIRAIRVIISIRVRCEVSLNNPSNNPI